MSPSSCDVRVLVVDDSPAVQRLVTAVLNAEPNMEVVGAANNGEQALELIATCRPNVIVLDLEMPGMDGPATYEALESVNPDCLVVVFTGVAPPSEGSLAVAIASGAVSAIAKPTGVAGLNEAFDRMRSTLLPAIRGQLSTNPSAPTPNPVATSAAPAETEAGHPPLKQRPARIDAVVIGSSTGGPDALDEFFANLTLPLPVPVFVVQHISEFFSGDMVRRLRKTARSAVEAVDGETPQPGGVYVAPGDQHLVLARTSPATVVMRLLDTPPVNSCRPSVDVLFESTAEIYRGNQVGLVMTGMGQDGMAGCAKLAERQATILAQDAETSVIWGMPGSVVKAGLADQVMPVADMARLLNHWLRS